MGKAAVTDDHVRRARRAYYGNVSYVDEWTSRLTSTLDSLGVADDTVVILLADHGDMLGERGLWYKMNFFEGSARIPMIVHAPHRFAARRVAAPVSLVDVLPTLLDITATTVDIVEPLAGRSLVALCDGGEDEREVIGEYMAEGSVAPIVMIRRGDTKYVHCPSDPDQLYDLAVDPHELCNLAADTSWTATVKELQAEVAARWDMPKLAGDVLADQARRRLIDTALRQGTFTPWDYTPPRNAAGEYMRNHLDLNEVERTARWPR
jgi:choline-sulfatase